MLNPRLDRLATYPFWRLTQLLENITPPEGTPLELHVGQPMLDPPAWVAEIIADSKATWRKYPPHPGTPEFRSACANWLDRRYRLGGTIDPERHVLPCAGTKEGLSHMALLCVPGAETLAGSEMPAVLMPNPVYQVYYGAAVLAGAEPVPISGTAETDFMPDYAGLDRALLRRTAMAYLCSPANPQGSCADMGYLQSLIRLAREYDFTLVVDECYSEIWRGEPPVGALEACQAMGGGFENVLVLHSLSKRSSAPGLRCGSVAGDERLIAGYRNLRSYCGVAVPEPILKAGEALLADETHVDETRAHYAKLFAIAERKLGNVSGFSNPQGGFFLWLEVPDGEEAATMLWRECGVKVMPGGYMAQPDHNTGENPCEGYIRIALVHDPDIVEDGLGRIAGVLEGRDA